MSRKESEVGWYGRERGLKGVKLVLLMNKRRTSLKLTDEVDLASVHLPLAAWVLGHWLALAAVWSRQPRIGFSGEVESGSLIGMTRVLVGQREPELSQ